MGTAERVGPHRLSLALSGLSSSSYWAATAGVDLGMSVLGACAVAVAGAAVDVAPWAGPDTSPLLCST